MFVDLITSLAYQLKIGGTKMRTCQEILKMVFSASTVIQASVQSLTRERSQFGDPLLSQKIWAEPHAQAMTKQSAE